jgi:hypothetical protein
METTSIGILAEKAVLGVVAPPVWTVLSRLWNRLPLSLCARPVLRQRFYDFAATAEEFKYSRQFSKRACGGENVNRNQYGVAGERRGDDEIGLGHAFPTVRLRKERRHFEHVACVVTSLVKVAFDVLRFHVLGMDMST